MANVEKSQHGFGFFYIDFAWAATNKLNPT